MELHHVALVSESAQVPFSELGRVSAALQKQALRDLAPIWGIQATVDSFSVLEDVPVGYWPIIIMDDIGVDAAGVHEDKDGQPFALVQADAGWALTSSHEALEMLVDPFGKNLISGQSKIAEQGRVEYLVEVCDPSEDFSFGYNVNGIRVSDFYTPQYFDPVANSSVRYSFTGAIKEPRQVLKGGYLSWHDPVSDHWFQETFFTGSSPKFRDLGVLTATAGANFRTLIYRATPESFKSRRPKAGQMASLTAAINSVSVSTNSKAEAWRQQITQLTGKVLPGPQ